MITDNEIGVYDSGVGGLTVLKELVEQMPDEKYVYFGDLKNLPYGEKSKEELEKIGRKIFDFFASKKVKAVVMACNTTSALLYDKVKNEYPFKIYPVIQTVSKYLAQKPVKKLGVFATAATINSHAYKKEINKYNPDIEVFEQACPNWVKIVENRDFSEKNIENIRNDLNIMLKNKPEAIVLGCTHYPYLIDILSKYSPKKIFINPAKKLAELIKKDMKAANLLSQDDCNKITFYVSDSAEKFIKSSEMFYSIKTTPILKNL